MTNAPIRSAMSRGPWWLALLEGIVLLVVGFLLIIAPGTTTSVLVQILGLYFLVSGILSLVSMFLDRGGWFWKLLSGILGIIAGILIIQHPIWSSVVVPTTLILLIGIVALVMGVIKVFQAFTGGGWGVGALGALSIFFGAVLLGAPLISAGLLPYVLGIGAFVGGIMAMANGYAMRTTG